MGGRMYIIKGWVHDPGYSWGRLDPSQGHVCLGTQAAIQGHFLYIGDEDLWRKVELTCKGHELPTASRPVPTIVVPVEVALKAVLGDTAEVLVIRSGVWEGRGHGREIIRALNPDGSLIYEYDHIAYCHGSGYSCSYSHGPWMKYGRYHGTREISADASLREVVALYLRGQATIDDLQNTFDRQLLQMDGTPGGEQEGDQND